MTSAPAAPRTFLTQLGALRAVAIVAVVVFHLTPDLLPGGFVGVDVLFVVSGLLITQLLLREQQGNGVRLRRFYGRRLARLMPAALTVIVVSGLLVVAFAARPVWEESARQGLASVFYVQNWYLVANSLRYIAASDLPTVFQHFWSLGVEGQLYLVWPLLLIAGVAALGLVRRLSVRTRVVLVLALVAVVSLAYSILNRDSEQLFFSTLARAWEFAIGGLLAAAAPALPRVARVASAIVGWVLLAGSMVLLSTAVHFPGYAALVPVSGAALVFLGGPARVYAVAPITFLATVSYSLYLWHWPLIVIWPFLTGTALTWSDNIAIAAVSLLVAWLTTLVVERRFWTPFSEATTVARRRVRSAIVFCACAVLVASGLSVAQLAILEQNKQQTEAALATLAAENGECFGAAALVTETCAAARPPSESALAFAAADWGVTWGTQLPAGFSCTTSSDGGDSEQLVCSYGSEHATKTVAIVGDSHAAQWADAVLPIAKANHWRMLVFDHPGCPALDTTDLSPTNGILEAGCSGWAADTVKAIESRRDIDYVLTSGYYGAYANQGDVAHVDAMMAPAIATMLDSAIDRWTATGKLVAVLGDTPHAIFDPPSCLATAATPLVDCAFDYTASGFQDTVTPLVVARDGVAVIDPVPWFCVSTMCAPVVGGVVPLVDNNHMSHTYATSLSAMLAERLVAAGWGR